MKYYAASKKHGVPEITVILLVAAVQFINIVDFMMVMPLGPDFARELGIDSSIAGLIGASYTVSAAIAALLSAQILDRFDRRKALSLALLGLSISTAAAALADNLAGLVITRLAAGMFGGPAGALAMAIMIDHVPEKRRGRAVGIVMSAFSLAAIAGVPFGLQFAMWWSWEAPFLITGLGAAIVLICTLTLLPPQIEHLKHPSSTLKFIDIFRNSNMQVALLITGFSMFSGFLLIPQLSAFFQFNLQFPRSEIAGLYMIGGATSFILLHITGRLVDRYSASPAGWLAMICIVPVIFGGYVMQLAWPVWLLFVGFMGANSIRNVAMQTLSSRVPTPPQRAGFLATQSAVRYITSAIAAVVATIILTQDQNQRLINMEWVGMLAVIAAIPIPFLIQSLQRRLGECQA